MHERISSLSKATNQRCLSCYVTCYYFIHCRTLEPVHMEGWYDSKNTEAARKRGKKEFALHRRIIKNKYMMDGNYYVGLDKIFLYIYICKIAIDKIEHVHIFHVPYMCCQHSINSKRIAKWLIYAQKLLLFHIMSLFFITLHKYFFPYFIIVSSSHISSMYVYAHSN